MIPYEQALGNSEGNLPFNRKQPLVGSLFAMTGLGVRIKGREHRDRTKSTAWEIKDKG